MNPLASQVGATRAPGIQLALNTEHREKLEVTGAVLSMCLPQVLYHLAKTTHPVSTGVLSSLPGQSSVVSKTYFGAGPQVFIVSG